MNIMYLNNSVHLGGDTKCILKLCKELKNENHIIMVSNGGILKSEFEDMGIRHYYIKNVQNKMPHTIISNILKLINIVKDEKIEIIHSHHRMCTLIAKIVGNIMNVKVIHTQHLCIEDKFRLTKIALNNVKIIAVSKAAKKILETKSNLYSNSITTIYNTIEVENSNKIVDDRLIHLKNSGYFIVAQVSRVIGYKGIYDFVEVANLTIQNNKNIRFVFIGDGPELEQMERYIVEKNMQNYIIMLGRKNNVIEHLKYIDLLLLCSYIEGLPLAPLEAFSQGVPVIATNIDGTNEEIIDGYNGYLVNAKDIESFAKKIDFIYTQKDFYIKMKKNAIDSYNSKFSTYEYIKEHYKIYKS